MAADLIDNAAKFYARCGRPSSAPISGRSGRSSPAPALFTEYAIRQERKKISRRAGVIAAYGKEVPTCMSFNQGRYPRLGEPIPLGRVVERWSRPPRYSLATAPPRPHSAPRIRPVSSAQRLDPDESCKQLSPPAVRPVWSAQRLDPDESCKQLSPPAEVGLITEVQIPAIWPPAVERLTSLVAHLTSPAVQVQVPDELEEVPAKLSAEEIESIFVSKVPGVNDMLFRGKAGEVVLKYIKMAYVSGLPAFRSTDLDSHLIWLLRTIVHYGQDDERNGAKYLRDIAEAFTDCQAVQARVIERVGLQIRGVSLDFLGLLTEHVGEYKVMALKILAYEECVKLGGPDETNDPPHFENRLLMDIGKDVGASVADIRRSGLDEHANKRFRPRNSDERNRLIERFRSLFDVNAMVHSLTCELNSLNDSSQPESFPRQFINWVAAGNISQKHIVFDEETCSKVEVQPVFVLAILEKVFLGTPAVQRNECYRDEPILRLFVNS